MAATDPKARLIMIGGGPSESSLRRRAARPDLAGKVHLTGQMPRREALSLAKGADLLIAASRTETQGLVLSEALAVGLPVVALAGPGVSDAVRDGADGLIVPVEPAGEWQEGLAAATRGLVRDPARRAALAAAAVEGAHRFDLATRIGEMVSLYRELLAEPS